MKNKLTQLNVGFTYKNVPSFNCDHFDFRGYRNDYGFARDNVKLCFDIAKGESKEEKKDRRGVFLLRKTFFSHFSRLHPTDSPVGEEKKNGKTRNFCEAPNPLLRFIVSGYLLSLVPWETCECFRIVDVCRGKRSREIYGEVDLEE